MIKAIIFDWGRTLMDHEVHELAEGAREVLDYCAKQYVLALVSITKFETPEQRLEKIKELDLARYFKAIEIVNEDKDSAYKRAVKQIDVPYLDIAVVDDRTARGIKWGNSRGCQTIWLQKGKFADELPNAETGQPTYIIHELRELLSIL